MKRITMLLTGLLVLGVIHVGLVNFRSSFAEAKDAQELTRSETIEKIAEYVAAQLLEGTPALLDAASIEAATGLTIPDDSNAEMEAAINRILTENGSEKQIQLAGGPGCATDAAKSGASCATDASANRCAEYGACSLYGDLAGASGETLEMYKREKAQDGTVFTESTPLPEFEGIDLEGNPVRSTELAGQPTMVVFLAGHCGHSIASIGILQKVADEFADKDLRIVGVFVNSGSADQVKSLVNLYKADYPVWLYPDASIGDVIDSHLVPTYFYVDADGSVKEKLVGMKSEEEVTKFVTSYMAEPQGE